MTAISYYSVGTISIPLNGTVATVAGGALLLSNAKADDTLIVDGFFPIDVVDILSDTQIAIDKWPGAAVVAGAYKIRKNGLNRYSDAEVAEGVVRLVEELDSDGYIIQVKSTETVPNPRKGDEGQFAWQWSTNTWWQRQLGVWTVSGPPVKGYGGTSATSLVIANVVTRVFATQANLGYSGARVRAASLSNPSNWMEGVCTYAGTTLTMTVDAIGGAGTKADWVFSIAGQPGNMSGGNNLSEITDKTAARFNISAASIEALAGINLAVNAAVNIAQEVGIPGGAGLVSGAAKYAADCYEAQYVHAAGTAAFSFNVYSLAAVALPLAGFVNANYLYCSTALSAPQNGDFALIRQKIEGYRIANLGWGAVGASPISYAFALYTSLAGTGFVKISNFDKSRCLVKDFTTPSGWFLVSDTVPGDVAGTWNVTNGIGMHFEVFLAGKSATPVITQGAWGVTNTVQTVNSGNLVSAASNNLMTGLFIKPGTQLVPSLAALALLMRSTDEELPLCQRYLETDFPPGVVPGNNVQKNSSVGFTYGTNAFISPQIGFYVRKRAAPTVTAYSSNAKAAPTAGQWQYYNGSAWVDSTGTAPVGASVDMFQVQFGGSGAANASWLIAGSWKADARL